MTKMKQIGQFKTYTVFLTSNKDRRFYCEMGKFFANRDIIKELEGPIYDSENYRWLVVKDDQNIIIAFASARFEKDNQVAWFNVAWVNPDHRRKGIYRHIFRVREGMCVAAGATILKGTALTHSRIVFDENGYTVTSQRGPRWTWFEKVIQDKKGTNK
jgi:GNAT superfamily N-acetyltransferase